MSRSKLHVGGEAVAVLAVLVATLAFAPSVLALEPYEQDPGTGGGSGGAGSPCYAMTCTACGEQCRNVGENQICWDKCFTIAESGGCDCDWEGEHCLGDYGVCTYTG